MLPQAGAWLPLTAAAWLNSPLPDALPARVQANMTPFAKQCLSEMAPKYYIELFQVGGAERLHAAELAAQSDVAQRSSRQRNKQARDGAAPQPRACSLHLPRLPPSRPAAWLQPRRRPSCW